MERKLLVTRGFEFNEVDNNGEKFARLDNYNLSRLTDDELRKFDNDEDIIEINADDKVYSVNESHLYVKIDVSVFNKKGLYEDIRIEYLLTKVVGNGLRIIYEYEEIDKITVPRQSKGAR